MYSIHLVHNHFTPESSKDRNKRKKEKNNFKSAIPFSGTATIIYRKRMSAQKEVTCTYLHHTKPHILSPCLSLSVCFSLSLCYLLNGRQHIGHTVPMRLQQNTTTCLTWDNKSQSHMGTFGRGWSTILSMRTHNLPQLDLQRHRQDWTSVILISQQGPRRVLEEKKKQATLCACFTNKYTQKKSEYNSDMFVTACHNFLFLATKFSFNLR